MFLGVDVGTGSSKGVLVDESGTVIREARRPHQTASPRPGWFEHDAETVWWDDVVALSRELLDGMASAVTGVCCSGIGPTVLVTDAADRPLRPAILYGIDTRCAAQAEAMNERIGLDRLLERVGNPLSTQSVGPKLRWIADEVPEVWEQARRFYSAPSWLVRQLTGEYVLDRYSASASDPLYDLVLRDYWDEMWQPYERLERPRLAASTEVVGQVTAAAAAATGIPAGTPVLAGTIDAMAEAYSVGCRDVGDTMVMYGSTLFLIQVVDTMVPSHLLWATEGHATDTYSLAAGMATGGLVTTWLSQVLGRDYADLAAQAARIPAGSEGLLLLPYFAGERTPVYDPLARGTWTGLTLAHTPGHLYRSALEGIALGVRHNLEAMAASGAQPRRLVAVGGGTAQRLWTQIVSDATGLPQDLPSLTVGAAYGDGRMAAEAAGIDTSGWNPVAERLQPNAEAGEVYDREFALYTGAYPAMAETMHELGTVAQSREPSAGA